MLSRRLYHPMPRNISNPLNLSDSTWMDVTTQYIPAIRCLDCPDKLFQVSSRQNVEEVEDHLNRSDHDHRVRLRCIAESETTKEALRTVTGRGGRVLQMALTDLTSLRLSIFQLEDRYFALTRQTLLILAVKNYAVHLFGLLLDEGLKVRKKDTAHRSPLHWACFLSRFDMAQRLIRRGARLDDRDGYNQTPLDFAVQAGNIDEAVNLIELEAKILQDFTPLARACRYGHLQIIEKMVSSLVDVNPGDKNPPLDVALCWAPWKAVQLLLEAGARTDTVSAVDLILLWNKKDAVYAGPQSAYRDAAEKLSLLEQYGVHPDRIRCIGQHVSRYL